MSNPESLPTPAGAKLHEVITDHAQCYVYGNESIEKIHASLEDYISEYRGIGESANDKEFEIIQQMRITREAILAAWGRVIGDEIIKKVLSYSTDAGELDIAQMTKNIKPTYCDGMIRFLDETVDTALCAMADSRHPYHALFQHTLDTETHYLNLLGNHTKKMGAMAATADPYSALVNMFTKNYYNDVASFLVTHGIAIQDRYDGDLPDADTIVEATKEARSHWLGIAALSRIHAGNLYFGKERYKSIIEAADRTGDFPTWSTHWPAGITVAMANRKAPFRTCPMQSPLIHRAPNDPIVASVKSPGRCAGQIPLYGSPEANENAIRLSKLVGDNLTETGRYSPAALLVDLGRTASKLSFSDPSFRKALIYAREVRDEMSNMR